MEARLVAPGQLDNVGRGEDHQAADAHDVAQLPEEEGGVVDVLERMAAEAASGMCMARLCGWMKAREAAGGRAGAPGARRQRGHDGVHGGGGGGGGSCDGDSRMARAAMMR